MVKINTTDPASFLEISCSVLQIKKLGHFAIDSMKQKKFDKGTKVNLVIRLVSDWLKMSKEFVILVDMTFTQQEFCQNKNFLPLIHTFCSFYGVDIFSPVGF